MQDACAYVVCWAPNAGLIAAHELRSKTSRALRAVAASSLCPRAPSISRIPSTMKYTNGTSILGCLERQRYVLMAAQCQNCLEC